MRLPHFIFHRLARYAINKVLTFPPDERLGPSDNVYMERWYVLPHNRYFNIYLHHFLRSDDDRALHDHPWASISLLLVGSYREHLRGGKSKKRLQGHFYLRRAVTAHRIELADAFVVGHKQQVLTLFLTGPHIREWGFLCPQGWRHWRIFTKQIGTGKSIGCGDYQ